LLSEFWYVSFVSLLDGVTQDKSLTGLHVPSPAGTALFPLKSHRQVLHPHSASPRLARLPVKAHVLCDIQTERESYTHTCTALLDLFVVPLPFYLVVFTYKVYTYPHTYTDMTYQITYIQ
jgi:hypothetical protein